MPIFLGVVLVNGSPLSRDCRFLLFDVEGQLSVAIELVNSPAGRPNNLGHVGSGNQHGENVAQPPVEPLRR